jgi:hypothetical protein
MTTFDIVYRNGVHKIYEKKWFGLKRKLIATITEDDGGIISAREKISNYLLSQCMYNFINENPGYEHYSMQGRSFE